MMLRRYILSHTCLTVLIALSPNMSTIGSRFEYEAVMMVTILSLVAIPFLFLLPSTRITLLQGFCTWNKYKKLLTWHTIVAPIMLIIITFLSMRISNCQCGTNSFFFWIIIQWFPAWIIVHGILYMLAFLYERGTTRKQILAVIFTLYTSTIIHISVSIWLDPQKRLTHPIMGFAHGFFYDQYIAMDEGIVIRRLAHLMIGLLLLITPYFFRNRKSKILIYLTFTSFISFTYYSSTYPSQFHGSAKLETVLPESYTYENLTIHYPSEFQQTKSSQKRIEKFFKEAMFHYQEVSRIIDHEKTNKIKIYVYPDKKTKKLWSGFGSKDYTDMYTSSIHTTVSSHQNGHPTLRYQLVYALAAHTSYLGLGIHSNMLFLEGLALALAPQQRYLSLDQEASLLAQAQKISNIGDVLSEDLWILGVKYEPKLEGSLIKFIINKYGFKKLIDIYMSKKILNDLDKTKDQVIYDWKKYIQNKSSKLNYEIKIANPLRKNHSLSKICPHSQEIFSISNPDFFERIRQPLVWNANSDYLKWRLEINPQDQHSKYKLWKKELSEIITKSKNIQGRLKTWVRLIATEKKWPPEDIVDAEIAILESDLLRATDEKAKSDDALVQLKHYADQEHVSDAILRKIFTRIFIEEEMAPSIATKWRNYLSGWSKIPKFKEDDSLWLTHYLYLRTDRHMSFSYYNKLIKTSLPQNLPQTFYVEWYRLIGTHLMQIGKYKESSHAFDIASKKSSQGSKAYFEMLSRKSNFIHETITKKI